MTFDAPHHLRSRFLIIKINKPNRVNDKKPTANQNLCYLLNTKEVWTANKNSCKLTTRKTLMLCMMPMYRQ